MIGTSDRAPPTRRLTSCGLPYRGSSDPRRRRNRFLAVAMCSRSAQEMLAATLRRSVLARTVRNEVVEVAGPVVPLQLAAGRHQVRVMEHLLLDSRPPHRPVGLSSAVVIDARLPRSVVDAVRGGEALCSVLERGGDYWTAETSEVDALRPTDGAPFLRLTRLLYLLGTPVAAVVEEIPLPDAADGRSPPGRP